MLNIKELEQITIQLAVNGMFWIDDQGDIRHANSAACQMLKYDYKELTTKSIFEIDPETSPQNLQRNYFDIIKKQGKYNFESLMIDKRGKEFPIEATVFHLLQGGKDYYCTFFLNIALRKKIKSDAEKSEALFRNLFENAADGMALMSVSGDWVDANQVLCEFLGYSKKEMFGLPFSVFHLDEKSILSAMQDLLNGSKQQIAYDKEFIDKDGKVQWGHVSISLMRDEMKQPGFLFMIVTDITRQVFITKALEESETRMRAIFNNHFQMTGLLDKQGRLVMANQAALELVGLNEEEVLGHYFWQTPWFAYSKKLQKKVKHYFTTAVEGEFVRAEYELADREGKRHIYDHSFKPVRDSDGNVQYVVPESRDITDIRLAEKELQKAYRELEKLKNQLQDENLFLKEELRGSQKYTNLVGKSNAFKNVLVQIEQVAETNATVLILGETGTGKELVAYSVHDLSNRRDKPLVKVNCAAIPATLIESELFGHEKGSFTGAHARKIGRFELADKGTIFLDEIGELPFDLQAKLLRVLQEGEFERIGSNRTIQVDIRIIAATNRDLKTMISENQFREDLYYRLHVFPVVIPPLRDRLDDVPLLADFLLGQISKRIGKNIKQISSNAMEKLLNYSWPGNVRELENVLERASVLSRVSTLEIGDWFVEETDDQARDSTLLTLDEVNRRHISRVVAKTKGRIRGEKGAARLLGLNPCTLESRMKKLNLLKSDISDTA